MGRLFSWSTQPAYRDRRDGRFAETAQIPWGGHSRQYGSASSGRADSTTTGPHLSWSFRASGATATAESRNLQWLARHRSRVENEREGNGFSLSFSLVSARSADPQTVCKTSQDPDHSALRPAPLQSEVYPDPSSSGCCRSRRRGPDRRPGRGFPSS
jgi:hypothetical protein